MAVSFPDPRLADEDGLLVFGGDLRPSTLLDAYARGIFPWPLETESGHELAWFSPCPRAILPLDKLHVPRRLARRLRNGEFQFTYDQAFSDVISACAAPRHDDSGTWITPGMKRAYRKLHQLGHAHSIEAWYAGELVGGVYGVAIGGFFSAESMFRRRRDASKAALVQLVRRLHDLGFTLFDIQQASDHTEQLGAYTISRNEFLRRLSDAVKLSANDRWLESRQ